MDRAGDSNTRSSASASIFIMDATSGTNGICVAAVSAPALAHDSSYSQLSMPDGFRVPLIRIKRSRTSYVFAILRIFASVNFASHNPPRCTIYFFQMRKLLFQICDGSFVIYTHTFTKLLADTSFVACSYRARTCYYSSMMFLTLALVVFCLCRTRNANQPSGSVISG